MMSSGVISVFIGMLPEMKTTEPYSPSARAKARAKPVSNAGQISGRMTRAKVVSRPAPERGRGLLDLGIEILEHRLHGADDKRQADEGQRDGDAERRKRGLDVDRPMGHESAHSASCAKYWPTQPVGA